MNGPLASARASCYNPPNPVPNLPLPRTFYTIFFKYELGFQIGLNESSLGQSIGHELWSVNVEPGLPVFANIYNVEDVPVDYAGPSRSLTGSAALGPGIQWEVDTHPGEISVPAEERRRAYSRFVGPAIGKTLSVDESAGYNIPVLTVNLEHPAESRLHNPFHHIASMLHYFGKVVYSVWQP